MAGCCCGARSCCCAYCWSALPLGAPGLLLWAAGEVVADTSELARPTPPRTDVSAV